MDWITITPSHPFYACYILHQVTLNMESRAPTVQLPTTMGNSNILLSLSPSTSFMSLLASFEHNIDTQLSTNEDIIR